MDTLIVITGPTSVGKTDIAIDVAKALQTEIVSADSRQVYQGIQITTAAPSAKELAECPHHLVGVLPLDAYYSASVFEQQALQLLQDIFRRCNGRAVVCGGSMMYIDALCNGLDDLPAIGAHTRNLVCERCDSMGGEYMLEWLKHLDPEFAEEVDPYNLKRICHAVEICLQSGTKYSLLRRRANKERHFRIVKVFLTLPRQALFERINTRVLKMLEEGMIDEVKSVMDYRHLNSLNTVGFKEMFKYLDGEWDLEYATARLQKNTRVYAKKQMTWFAKDRDVIAVDATDKISAVSEILKLTRNI